MTGIAAGLTRVIQLGKRSVQSFLAAMRMPDLPTHLRLKGEHGKSLPAALITLAVGSLLLTPFVSFVSTRSLGSRSAESTLAIQYAADAGIEFGIWSLNNDTTFRSLVDNNLGTPQILSFPGSLNGITPSISVTGLQLGSWTIRQSAPGVFQQGASLTYAGGDRIYALYGNNSKGFGYYSISGDAWFNLANTPENVKQGGALVYGGGNYLYAFQGNKKTEFWRYDIAFNSWSNMQDAPEKVDQGGELVWTGGDLIFAFRGNKEDFWSYSIAADSWTIQTPAPDKVGSGSDLVYTGGNSIYAFQGRNKTNFWIYNISSNSWGNLQAAPAKVTDGGGLAYYSGGFIYAFGGKSNVFWRYTIATNSWDTMMNAPQAVGMGGDLLFTQATRGYAIRGDKKTDTWEFEVTPPRYDIHADSGSVTTDARIEIDGLNTSVLYWDIE